MKYDEKVHFNYVGVSWFSDHGLKPLYSTGEPLVMQDQEVGRFKTTYQEVGGSCNL